MSVAALAAAVWTGGHRVLDLGGLPKAQRAREAGAIRTFEERFEPVGLGSTSIQVVSRLGMVEIVLHAHLRLIPHLRDTNLSPLAWHIRAVTALEVAFVVVGAGIRRGGFG